MTDLKRRVASQKTLQFLQNNKVIFFFQKKSVQSDHWRLLKIKIAKIEGVASLNLKNKRDKREIQPLILSYLTSQKKSPCKELYSENEIEVAERICGLLYAPNLILGSDSLKKLAHLCHQLREDSSLIFIGGWDGNQLINHLDSIKLLETPHDIWKEGVSCLSSGYARPYLFLHSLLEKRKNHLVSSLKEKMHALIRSLQEMRDRERKEE